MEQAIFERWAQETVQIREHIIQMIHQAGSGHPGGSLSLVEILYSLYATDGVMRYDPSNPVTNDRDRFVLSKGHGCPALYAVMSATGHDISSEELMTLRHLGSRLQGHPDRIRIPYVEASTGSLGQGASIAQGMALAYKLDKNPRRIFSVIGDGESQEGQIWEVALSASHYKLNNLTLIMDYNKGQIDGLTNEVVNLEPLRQKWEAFGWRVYVVDGHNYKALIEALTDPAHDRPTMIIANTIKGKGVSFMEENTVAWHGKAPNDEEMELALAEIKNNTTIGL